MVLALAISSPSHAMDSADVYDPSAFDSTGEYLQDQRFFESPASMVMPEVKNVGKRDYTDYAFEQRAGGSGEYKEIDPDKMPLFKKIRLSVQHKISSRVEERERRIESGEDKGLLEKLKFWDKDKNATENLSETEKLMLSEQGSIVESIQKEMTSEDSSDAIALESGVSKHVTEKEMVLDSDKITYDDESGDMIAHGRPHLSFPQQGLKVLSDTMLYNQDSNILKGSGDVVVFKGQMPIKADSFEIDMNEETMIMSNIAAYTEEFIMDADKAMQKDSKLYFENGYLHSDVSKIHRFHSRMVGPRFWDMIVDPEKQALFLSDPTGNDLHLDIDEVLVDARSNHNKYIAKKIRIKKKWQA